VVLGCSALIKPPAPSTGSGPATPARKSNRSAAAAGRPVTKADSQPVCPDPSDPAALADADWSGDFSLTDEEARTLTRALTAAAGVQALSTKLDTDLRTACTGIARELGLKADGDGIEPACAAAVRAINESRVRLGGAARYSVAYVAPRCALPERAITGCLKRCGAGEGAGGESSSAPRARLECPTPASSGVCDGICSGNCDVAEGMVCDGHCYGGCDWGFHGWCDGTCVGSCNGRRAHGICNGRCVGQCNGVVKQGSCRGRCLGPCDLRHPVSCAGTCSGRCAGTWKNLQCESVPRTAGVDAACAASCDADLSPAASCSNARVTVTIDHTHHVARAKRLAIALERYLPAILRVSVGMKARAAAATRSAQAALSASDDLMSSADSRGEAGAALSSCASGPLRTGLAAIGSVNVSIRVAIEVKTATDASDNAGGHHRG
jgi:hypothetical protein